MYDIEECIKQVRGEKINTDGATAASAPRSRNNGADGLAHVVEHPHHTGVLGRFVRRRRRG